jgi:hypothetical protein
MKFACLLSLLCFRFDISDAQAKRLQYIGVEMGSTFIQSEMSEMDFIRGDVPAYYMGYNAKSLTSLSYKNFAGIKYEIFSVNDRLSILTGLRISHMVNSIGKNNYWSNNVNYFYWLYRQDGTNTEYLLVKDIIQKSDYIGIPVEVKYFTGRRPRKMQLYVKVGTEMNYLVNTRTGIVFDNPAMNIYQKDLTAMVEKPGKFFSSIYGGVGFKIGRDQKPSLSLEACGPYYIFTSKSAGLLHPIIGGGFQLNVQIPIKSGGK